MTLRLPVYYVFHSEQNVVKCILDKVIKMLFFVVDRRHQVWEGDSSREDKTCHESL